MTDLIHILHLSDLQFTAPSDVDIYRTNLAADLKRQAVESLSYLVISGDVARQGQAEEYASAVDFVNQLAQQFDLPKERIIVVPGNHDVDWTLSKSSYDFKYTEDLPDDFSPNNKFITMGAGGGLLRNDSRYPQRFQPFSQYFYQPVTESGYPLAVIEQGIVKSYPDDRILFLILNSAWDIDHHFTDRATINASALSAAIDSLMAGDYTNWLKIAVWHHPVSGPRAMNDAFLAQLAQQSFQFGLHGHIQHPDEVFYSHHKQHNLHLIGAGCFGDPATPGRPFRYHLLTWNRLMQQLTVNTRQRTAQEVVWTADQRHSISLAPNDDLPDRTRPLLTEVDQARRGLIEINISDTGQPDTYRVRLNLPGRDKSFTVKQMILNLSELQTNYDQADYGRYLGQALFADQAIGPDYREALAVIQQEQAGPQVMLHLENEVLAEVRWERLYHPIAGHWHPLAGMARTPFSRQILTDGWDTPHPLTSQKLPLLVVVASPQNLADYDLAAISSKERQNLKAIFAGLPDFEPTFLESGTSTPPTLDNLKRELAKGYHLVHFLGHGSRGRRGSNIFMEDAYGKVDLVTAETLTDVFANLQAPPLFCFLAACESGAQDKNSAETFISLGPELVKRGRLGAVVAMSDRISLATAAAFTGQFYTRLLRHGQLDLAVNEARALVKENWDWSVPVLFSRLLNNQLLAQAEADSPLSVSPDPETGPPKPEPTPKSIQPSPPPDTITEVSLTEAEIKARLKNLAEEKLNTLCYDLAAAVYANFSSATSKRRKINLLLDHCRDNDLTGELSARLARE